MRIRASSVTLSMVVRSWRGKAWKWMGTTVQPRFIIRQAATGESIPPESSAATRPEVPTGKPPAPGWRSKE